MHQYQKKTHESKRGDYNVTSIEKEAGLMSHVCNWHWTQIILCAVGSNWCQCIHFSVALRRPKELLAFFATVRQKFTLRKKLGDVLQFENMQMTGHKINYPGMQQEMDYRSMQNWICCVPLWVKFTVNEITINQYSQAMFSHGYEISYPCITRRHLWVGSDWFSTL